jgi:hypothetical protein
MDVIGLFSGLRDRGFSIGIDQYLSAHRLIAQVSANSERPPHPTVYKTLLAPLICRSPEEQARFYTYFDSWVGALPPPARLDDDEHDQERIVREIEHAQKAGLLLRLGVTGSIVVALLSLPVVKSIVHGLEAQMADSFSIVIAKLPVAPKGSPAPPTKPPPDAQPPQVNEKATVGGSEATALEAYKGHRWKWFTPIVAMLVFLGWRHRFRRVLGRALTPAGASVARLDIGRGLEGLIGVRALQASGRRLRERVFIAEDILDPVATAEATARALGRVSELHRPRFGQPEYLCLIDRRSAVDQQFDAILLLLRRMAINAVIYTFDRDPRHCRSLRRYDKTRSLADLARNHGDHRLLVFSDGAGLVDRRTGRVAEWIGRAFDPWRDRTLLTPVASGEWTNREVDLRRAGFELIPGSTEGVLGLRLSRTHAHGVGSGADAWLEPMPPLLAEAETRWRDAIPPPSADVEQLEAELESYLGSQGFVWLRACAVFPELHLGLILMLGARLEDAVGRPIGTIQRLDRLLRLPWFRYGRLPDWLRRSLIGGLESSRRRRVRFVVCRWLADDAATALGGKDVLAFVRRTMAEALVQAWARKQPPESQLRERLFYGFLTDDLLQRAAFVVPRQARALLDGIKTRRPEASHLASALVLLLTVAKLRWPAIRIPIHLGTTVLNEMLLAAGALGVAAIALGIGDWLLTGLVIPVRRLSERLFKAHEWVGKLLLASSTIIGVLCLLDSDGADLPRVVVLYPAALSLMLLRRVALTAPAGTER